MGVDLGEGLFIFGMIAFGGKGDNGTDDGGTGEVLDGVDWDADAPPAIRSEREGAGLLVITWVLVLSCRSLQNKKSERDRYVSIQWVLLQAWWVGDMVHLPLMVVVEVEGCCAVFEAGRVAVKVWIRTEVKVRWHLGYKA